MTPLDEAQSAQVFIHSVNFGSDGVEIVYEEAHRQSDSRTEMKIAQIICEGNPLYENIYLDVQNLLISLNDDNEAHARG